jgi:Uma2 family endonuclease
MTTVTQWIEQAPEDVKERFEYIDGRWKEREVAGLDHQRVGRRLINELERRGLTAEGGVRIYLPVRGPDDPDWVVPDAFVVSRDNPAQPGPASYEGVPDLVVEVLAADNDAGEDLPKKQQYARAGVRHYWLVRLTGMTLEASVLGECEGTEPCAYLVHSTGPLLPLTALPVPPDLS